MGKHQPRQAPSSGSFLYFFKTAILTEDNLIIIKQIVFEQNM